MHLTAMQEVQFNCVENTVLRRAWKRWRRDVDMTMLPSESEVCRFEVEISGSLVKEAYEIRVEENKIQIQAGDELGVIYGFLYLSERFLGIAPFWFWNDQTFERKSFIDIPNGKYVSPVYKLRFRGWFINDEVLLDAWGKDRFDEDTGITENEAFEMAMEALLRLGGNMVIPGTDHNSHKYTKLAADMGLWITHHHAEPLGAKMFAREYPDKIPSYRQYPELFHGLWRKAIEEQSAYKVIWNIGFRGQGDRPFWADDPQYDTPQKRGELISSLIKKQYDMLCEYMEEPICCTNLYGEVMELYRQGFISLPENVIYIWADNGYGKMVSRRQGNHNPRIEALPAKPQGRHGIYYHASFYDLQAASHITMLPNSVEFVERELNGAMERGVKDFLVVNCSNVRPHTYMLHAIADIWGKEQEVYTLLYYPLCGDRVRQLYDRYFGALISYGDHEDEHAGEQFYHYTMRAVCHGWLASRFEEAEPALKWAAGECSLTEQVRWLRDKVEDALPGLSKYYEDCMAFIPAGNEPSSSARTMPRGSNTHRLAAGYLTEGSNHVDGARERQLFSDSVLLQATIHYKSLLAEKVMCEAYEDSLKGQQEQAFLKIGRSIEYLQEILAAMKAADHDKWEGFYDNDCLTDVKFTVHMLRHVMGYIRNLGEGPNFYRWALKYGDGGINNGVVLITNMRNHLTDWEMYLMMKGEETYR